MHPEQIEKDRATVKPIMEWYRIQDRPKQLAVRRTIAGVRVELYKWRIGWYEQRRAS